MAPGGTIVNISGLTPVEDPSYRYKMPLVFGKIEGSGNGIKTVIPNISDVGMSLHRPPAEVNKFFGCELGAQTSYAPDTDRAVVNGAHVDAALQQLVHKYVDMFVLCPTCGLPETRYKIKNESIWHRCAACGAKEMVDMTHKLTNFILAQDKKEKREAKAREKKAGKEKKKKEDDGSDKDEGEKKKKDKKKSKDKDKDKKDKKKKDKKKKEKKASSDDDGSKGSDDLADEVDDLSLGDDVVDDAFAMST
jgi:translation initiation factor 5